MELKEWAARAMRNALHDATQASTATRRAFHEGQAAAFALACGDENRGRNLLHVILVDYAGSRAVQGREGYRTGAAKIRGVADYLDAVGDRNVDEWMTDAGAGVSADA